MSRLIVIAVLRWLDNNGAELGNGFLTLRGGQTFNLYNRESLMGLCDEIEKGAVNDAT
jgi:hypothetical protein